MRLKPGCRMYLVGCLSLLLTSLPVALDHGAGLPGLVVAMVFIGLGAGCIRATYFPFLGKLAWSPIAEDVAHSLSQATNISRRSRSFCGTRTANSLSLMALARCSLCTTSITGLQPRESFESIHLLIHPDQVHERSRIIDYRHDVLGEGGRLLGCLCAVHSLSIRIDRCLDRLR